MWSGKQEGRGGSFEIRGFGARTSLRRCAESRSRPSCTREGKVGGQSPKNMKEPIRKRFK